MLNEELCICTRCQCQRKQHPTIAGIQKYQEIKDIYFRRKEDRELLKIDIDKMCQDCRDGNHFNNEDQYQQNHKTKKDLC